MGEKFAGTPIGEHFVAGEPSLPSCREVLDPR